MDALDRHAELIKLARLLAVEPEELAFLNEEAPAELREFREAATHSLFDDGRETFRRLAKLSRLLPIPLLARFTSAFVGPELAARVASEMDPKRAADLAIKLPTEFLAEVCLHLEPGRSREVIRGIPADRVAAITRVLLETKEYVCMARFVDVLAEPILRSMIGIIESKAHLQIGFFVEDKAQLDTLVGLFDDTRLRGLIEAAREKALWPQAIALMSHVSPDTCARIGNIAAGRSEATLNSLVRAAHRENLWALLLGIVGHMSVPGQRRVAQLEALGDEGVLEGIVTAAVDSEHWEVAIPLLSWLPIDRRERALEYALVQGVPIQEIVGTLISLPTAHPALLEIYEGLSEGLRERIVESSASV